MLPAYRKMIDYEKYHEHYEERWYEDSTHIWFVCSSVMKFW